MKKKLKSAQRKVSRRKKGSKSRKKTIKQLAKKYIKVADTRKYLQYKTVSQLLYKYDIIAVEKLNIKAMDKLKLAKSLHNAGWGQFNQILKSKVVSLGYIERKIYSTHLNIYKFEGTIILHL